jgi:hypothetical protein
MHTGFVVIYGAEPEFVNRAALQCVAISDCKMNTGFVVIYGAEPEFVNRAALQCVAISDCKMNTGFVVIYGAEPEFVNLLRSPGIDSQPTNPIRHTGPPG